MAVKSAGAGIRGQGAGDRFCALRHITISPEDAPLVNYRCLQMRRPGGHMCRR